VLGLVLATACTDDFTAPGNCPNFCPGGQIGIADTILRDVIVRDSSFRGYVSPAGAEQMAVADIPGVVDSRALFLMNKMFLRVTPNAGDTATVPITVDSSRLRIEIVRRDTNATNLVLRLYRLPLTIDSTSTFASTDADFTATPIDSVNISDLLAAPELTDTATLRIWGDTIQTDSAGHTLQISPTDSSLILFFDLDTLRAPFVAADSGQLAFGLRVSADTLASIAIGANEFADRDPQITWFYHYTIPDTLPAPDSVKQASIPRETIFDSFVFNPPNAALDDNLTIGGAPSARALMRVDIPDFLRDSADVVRATLVLVPVAPVQGAAGDSFTVLIRPVLTDLGAKSPLATRAALFGRQMVHIGTADTLRIELTNLIRTWARDTSQITAMVMGQVPEASSYTEVRFYSSRTPAFRPALHVTYVKRFPFGEP
jgi:hypothetical protein